MYAPSQIALAENEFELRFNDDGSVASRYQLVDVRGELELPIGFSVGDVFHREASIAPMTGIEEDMLTGDHGDPMIRIVASCVTRLGPIEVRYDDRSTETRRSMLEAVKKLTIADITFLLFAIRRRSFVTGNDYKFSVLCRNKRCKNRQHNHRVDLGSLNIRPAPSNVARIYEYRLPVTGKVVRFGMPGSNDIDRLIALQKQHEEDRASVELYASIIDVDGAKLKSYLDTKMWPLDDRDSLRGEMSDKVNYGIDVKVDVADCPGCGSTMEVGIDIKPGFFRPTLSR